MLAQLHGPVRSVAEKSGEVAYAARLAVVGIYTSRARIRLETTKANIWSLATKNSGRANRRVDLFPYNAAFFAFFFRLSATTFSRLPLTPPTPQDAYIAENIRASI